MGGGRGGVWHFVWRLSLIQIYNSRSVAPTDKSTDLTAARLNLSSLHMSNCHATWFRAQQRIKVSADVDAAC